MSGAPVGMSWVVMVGVMRLTGTSCCRWDAAGFGLDAAGVRGFGGACLVHSCGPCGSGSAWGLEGGEGDVGCGIESGMSASGRSVDTCVGADETECVVSVDFVVVVCVSSWVLVV